VSYIVLMRFADLQDGNRIYEAGDTYPRPGFDVSPERLAELAGSDNRMGEPLIVDVDAPCDACAVEALETPVEAPEDEPKEIPAESVEAPAKARRSRKKG
jgi:hypothetical protein